ncbi:hypothetical protein RRJ79_004631 [Vibrio parahaemolyticus]|nr:hypothetical protein [Vibrio parahaemolyticus]
MGICKLCCKEREIKKSHIIPNAFFKFIKQKQGDKSGKLILSDTKNTRWDQETFYERLLCGECENKFSGNFENYAASLMLRDGSNTDSEVQYLNSRELLIKNLDFEKFKLFQMSLLWRASVSANDFYKHVKLPTSEEERLRVRLDQLQSISPTDYPCILERVLTDLIPDHTDSDASKKIITNPMFTKTVLGDYYTFVLGGWSMRMYSKVSSQLPKERIINDSGLVKCMRISVEQHEILKLAGVRLRGHRDNEQCQLSKEA